MNERRCRRRHDDAQFSTFFLFIVPFETENSTFFFQFKFLVLLIFLFSFFFFFSPVWTHFRMEKQKEMNGERKWGFQDFRYFGSRMLAAIVWTHDRISNRWQNILEHTPLPLNFYFICDEWRMECYKSMALTPDTWMFLFVSKQFYWLRTAQILRTAATVANTTECEEAQRKNCERSNQNIYERIKNAKSLMIRRAVVWRPCNRNDAIVAFNVCAMKCTVHKSAVTINTQSHFFFLLFVVFVRLEKLTKVNARLHTPGISENPNKMERNEERGRERDGKKPKAHRNWPNNNAPQL